MQLWLGMHHFRAIPFFREPGDTLTDAQVVEFLDDGSDEQHDAEDVEIRGPFPVNRVLYPLPTGSGAFWWSDEAYYLILFHELTHSIGNRALFDRAWADRKL